MCLFLWVSMNQTDPKNVAGVPVTIFIVDDEPLLLDLAAAILEPLGYDVRTFSDPEAALAAYSAVKPSLVVTDFALGKMNGLDLIRECKRLAPRQKAMLVSGTVDQHIYDDCPAKPDAFLSKPYQINDLIASVQKLAQL
jgi:CheY-like chemotaxis protein